MFMGPIEASKPWSDSGVEGARRFIERVWRFFTSPENITTENDGKLDKAYHVMVKKVTNDFEELAFNTAISAMMIFVNECYKVGSCPKEYAEGFVKMISCITPHLGEELWQIFGHDHTLAYEPWPTYDEEKTKDQEYEMVVQVNGKVRGKMMVATDTSKEEMEELAKQLDNVKKFTEGKEIVKTIVVPKKLVNIVVK